MPTLIELSPEKAEQLGVSHLFQVPNPKTGEPYPEFILDIEDDDGWLPEPWYGDLSDGSFENCSAYRFARRATQSEIESTEASPSVGRDHLHPQVRQLLEQLRGAVNHFPDGQWTLHETEMAVHELCHLLLDFGDGYLVKPDASTISTLKKGPQ